MPSFRSATLKVQNGFYRPACLAAPILTTVVSMNAANAAVSPAQWGMQVPKKSPSNGKRVRSSRF